LLTTVVINTDAIALTVPKPVLVRRQPTTERR
jgi:hypothetical protein